MQRHVRDLMRIRHGNVVAETTTLREVAERLIVSDCDVMAVTDSSGRLIGIVCESSVVRALMASPSDDATIQAIVMRHAESVRIDAPLTGVLPLFRSSANTAVPVVNQENQVCGLLLRRDVITSLLHRRLDSAEAATSSPGPPAVTKSTALNPAVASEENSLQSKAVESDGSGIQPGQPRPHFLRAEAARRYLWSSAEDRL